MRGDLRPHRASSDYSRFANAVEHCGHDPPLFGFQPAAAMWMGFTEENMPIIPRTQALAAVF
jgi:hypothetical protein